MLDASAFIIVAGLVLSCLLFEIFSIYVLDENYSLKVRRLFSSLALP